MTETKQEINEQGEALGLGERLKQAREAKKLSLDEVAAQLRIAKVWLDSIEKEAWGALPSRTYARGYFISYVKFMGLPEDTLLSLFNLQYAEPIKVAPSLNQKQTSNVKMKVLVVVIVPLLLIASAWFGWQFLFENKQNDEVAWLQEGSNIPHSQFNEKTHINGYSTSRISGFEYNNQYDA